MFICRERSGNATTGPDGTAEIEIHGGGAGTFSIEWVLYATCVEPGYLVCSGISSFLSKSLDLIKVVPPGGDSTHTIVNFQDTFYFMPELGSGTGRSGDFTCDWVVDFQDVFRHFPHLAFQHACEGFAMRRP
jgi:hypothetical protein